MPASRSATVEETITHKVLDVLQKYDGFLNLDELSVLLETPKKNLRSALWWLQKIQAIECIDSAGTPYWFATPENDLRRRALEERRKEDEPRKSGPRKARKKNEPHP